MEAIVAERVQKSYGATVALQGVTVTVESGSVFALLGPNGSGKTTLIRCLTGTTRLDNGAVRLLGEPPQQIDKSRLGLLPQEFRPPDRLTAQELVSYYSGLYDSPRTVADTLDAVGLTESADTWYMNLSGGQQRRVLVGISLVNSPEVLFLDEPTTGIDPAGRQRVWSLIDNLAAGGTTVFMTTHDMREAERLADRVGILDNGNLIAAGTPGALIAEYGAESSLIVKSEFTDGTLDIAGHSVMKTDRSYIIRDVSPQDIGGIITELDATGLTYTSLIWRQPDLETIYLDLTGKPPASTTLAAPPTLKEPG